LKVAGPENSTADIIRDDKNQPPKGADPHLHESARPVGKFSESKESTGAPHLTDKLSISDGHNTNDKPGPGDHHYSFNVDGMAREYEVHLPPSYDGSKPVPVMYLMPGVGGSIEQMKKETGMNREADEKGFAVVYVQALPKPFPGSFGYSEATSWNLDHGSLTPKSAGYDDTDYMKAVDKRIGHEINVDDKAKYIAGFSEGGGAAQYVAESMPHTFAGVGSVHGTHLDSDPAPGKGDPTAFVAIHGDDDNMLPISGGHGWGEGWRPVKGFMTLTMGKVSQSEPLKQKEVWSKANDCSTDTVTETKKNRTTEYSCTGGPVEEIIRHQGEHSWDGLGQTPSDGNPRAFVWRMLGDPDRTQNTSDDLVKALMRFRKPDGTINVARDFN
jgi:poly(3-hydroxybutyrate) depolymerase